MRLGQGEREGMPVMEHLGDADDGGLDGDWRVAVEIEAEDDRKVPRLRVEVRVDALLAGTRTEGWARG